jgi:hypothetical protein
MDNIKMKVPFNGFNKIEKKYSQCFQDIFVLTVLNGKENGTYLELGCGGPTFLNNTYNLEKNFNWNGISYDLDERSILDFNKIRKNEAIVKDCLNLDYDYIIDKIGNKIDYLSLDLEPAEITLKCLKSIPLDKIDFNVITFEHDKYRFGDNVQKESQKIFKDNGYVLVAEDVGDPITNPFEDWYVKNVNLDRIKPLFSKITESKDVLFHSID